MPAPDLDAVKAYLTSIDMGSSWADSVVTEALAAETAAQARVCRVPVAGAGAPGDPDPWIGLEDLAEALKRRVARNLTLRPLPLGIQTTVSEAGAGAIRIGFDYEIKRLEAPFRKVTVG